MSRARPQPDLRESESIRWAFLILLLAFSFAIGFFKLSSHDTFWHLKTGEYILSNGIPSEDPFSFTAAGKHWVTHEWLAEVLLYLIYFLGGVAGLIVLKGSMSALIAFLIFRFGTRRGVSSPLSAAVAIFAIGAMSYMMYARPHAFTFLFLALLCMILFDSDSGEKPRSIYRWIIIPGIFLLWANIHAGFLLGLAIYWVVVIGDIFMIRDIPFTERAKTIVVPAVFATLVCLINPSGIEIFYYPIMISTTPIFKSTIAEWVSPIYLGKEEWLAKGILIAASAFGLLAAVFHLRHRPAISAVVIAVGLSAWTAMRNIQNYAVVLAYGLLALPQANSEFRLLRRSRWLPATVAAVWMILLFGLIRDYQAHNGRAGFGIKAGLVAEGPAEFLRKANFKGNIISALHDGAYLIWKGYPDWKVFIDGRLDVYGPEFLEKYRHIIEGGPGALAAMESYGVDAAVLAMPPYIGAIRSRLSGNSSWPLVYYDDYYLVYLRRGDRNLPLIDKYRFDVVNPLTSGFGLSQQGDLERFYEESIRGLDSNPNSSLANAVNAYALQNRGDFTGAAHSYKRAVQILPNKKDMYRSVANMYMQAGQNDSAKSWYELALKARPNDPQTLYELGFLYARINDLDNAERYLEQSATLYPSGPATAMLERLRAVRSSRGKSPVTK